MTLQLWEWNMVQKTCLGLWAADSKTGGRRRCQSGNITNYSSSLCVMCLARKLQQPTQIIYSRPSLSRQFPSCAFDWQTTTIHLWRIKIICTSSNRNDVSCCCTFTKKKLGGYILICVPLVLHILKLTQEIRDPLWPWKCVFVCSQNLLTFSAFKAMYYICCIWRPKVSEFSKVFF